MRILIACLLVLTAANTYSQKCKYKINELDKFTHKFTKLTKSEKVISSFQTSGEFSIKKIDTSYFFIFDYTICSYSNFERISIKKASQLMFLLENGVTINLNSDDDINGIKKFIPGIPPSYCCTLSNVSYPLSKNQIDEFFKSKVKSIRFYRTEGNGKDDFIDCDIKSRNQDDIQNLVKCVL